MSWCEFRGFWGILQRSRQNVSGVLFLARYFPLVLGDELAVFVVVEAGDAVAVGGADEVAV